MYFLILREMKKQLGQLDKWLETATAYAKERSFEVDTLLTARLAPDQFHLARQIQTTCDGPKLGFARLTGKDAPSHPDKETTVAELRARVATTLTHLETITEKDLEGCDARSITTPRWEGRTMTGADYFVEHVLPNFYFHLTTVYAILRHNGVPLGKRDYLGTLTQKSPSP